MTRTTESVRREAADAFAAVAVDMLRRLDEVTDTLVASILSGDMAYSADPDSTPVSVTDLRLSCRDNLTRVLGVLARIDPLSPSLTIPRTTGERRAEQGLPLESLLHAYRLGGQVIWQEMVAVLLSQAEPGGDPQELLGAATAVWTTVDAFSVAAAAGYRSAEARLDLRRDRRLTALLGELLSGRVDEHEAALALGLPVHGRFLVAATAITHGEETADRAAAALATRGIASVWRPHGQREIGIICLPVETRSTQAAHSADDVVDALRGTATGPMGISGVFTRLRDVGSGFADACGALDTLPPDITTVASLNDRVLAAILGRSPELASRHARSCLGGLDSVAPSERATLMATLQSWFDCVGDVQATATALFCHRNTVSNRLHRLEALTGLSVEVPNHVALLHLALLSQSLGLVSID